MRYDAKAGAGLFHVWKVARRGTCRIKRAASTWVNSAALALNTSMCCRERNREPRSILPPRLGIR